MSDQRGRRARLRDALGYERINAVLQWVWFVALLEGLFLVGALAGIVVLGVFPAFFACIFVAQELIDEGWGTSVFGRFRRLYRAVWRRANEVGLVTVVWNLACAANVVWFAQLRATRHWCLALELLWLVVWITTACTWLVAAPTLVDHGLPLRELPRLMLAALGDPVVLLAIIVGSGVLLLGVRTLPGVFICISLGAFLLLVAACQRRFVRRRVVLVAAN